MFELKNINRKKYILPSVLVIAMCLTFFFGAAWAWYTNQAATKVEKIEAATYSVKVEVFDSKDKEVVVSDDSNTSHMIDLTSNSVYKVKLTGSGKASTGYAVISFVDHVTNEVKTYYTPAIAPRTEFEFTYQNGVFESVDGMATIKWENKYKSTPDLLKIDTYWGTTEETVIAANAVLGHEVFPKPASQTVQTNWKMGENVGSSKHTVGPNALTPGQHYAHTDVITVAKKGTKLTFKDDVKTNSWASDGCYVVSSWVEDENGTWEQDGKKWKMDLTATNIPGKYKNSSITCTSGYEYFVERHGTEDDDGSITYTYITSKDNENIMFCYYAGKGTTSFPKITMTYSGEMGTTEEIALAADTATWLNAQKTGEPYTTYNTVFAGKKISVIGDSYMAGSDIKDKSSVWINMFAAKYGMTLNNYGVNGSTISNFAGNKYNPMVDRWEEAFADDTPDIIIVEGGRNDYNYNVPMGELGTKDKATFKGATAYLISSLKEKFPNALIIGITCWEVGGTKNDAGYYCSDYGRAFIEVCKEQGISYVNAMDSIDMGIYMTSSNFRGRFCIKAGDISHLNEKGMKRVLPVFEKKIYDMYNAHVNPVQP